MNKDLYKIIIESIKEVICSTLIITAITIIGLFLLYISKL